MTARRFFVLPFWFATTLSAADTAAAQRVELRGRAEVETDTILQRVVREGRHRLIVADTVFPPSDTIRGPILIAATTVKFENIIVGDMVIVDANVFMRPHSRITGDVTNIAGGFFRAETARVDGAVREFKETTYYAEQRSDGVRITGTRLASLVDLDGFGGFHAPTYDRVAGLTASFGARYLLPRIGLSEPDIHGWVGYQTAREALIGGGEIGIRRGNLRIAAGAERLVLTNDAWARGWTNSISYLANGHDYRDYYGADRFYVGPSLSLAGERHGVTFRLTAQIEDATSLASNDVWHLSSDSARANPDIDDGRSTSVRLGVDGTWEGLRYASRFDAAVEVARLALGGDHRFARFDLGGQWAMQAVADHTFVIEWRLRGPLPGTDSLPRQRWNILGGRATLHTLDEAELRGDRLAYVESVYSVPFPAAIDLPILGRPWLEAMHRVGSAWTHDADSRFTQNIGLRLRARIAYALAVTDPSGGRTRYFIGLSLRRNFPWSPPS